MRDRGVAPRYARALVEAAKADNILMDVADTYAAVVQVVDANPALPSFLEGPQVAEDEKKQLISNVFGEKCEPLLIRFFSLLLDKNRIEYLREIGDVFAEMVEKEQGVTRAVVATAIPLPADLESLLSQRLASITGSRIVLEKKVDPAVIGGVSVTLGDRIIDGTVRNNLTLLRDQLGQAAIR